MPSPFSLWYTTYIEAGIRRQVRLLRDNGFNTTSSCAHRMDVVANVLPGGEIQRLHDLLVQNGFKEFTIYQRHELRNGVTFSELCVHFGKPTKKLRSLAWWVDENIDQPPRKEQRGA